MMIVCTIFILFLCLPGFNTTRYQKWSNRYDIANNVEQIPYRLIDLMRVIYNGAAQRITDANGLRFKYEETREYEQGYLMAEILERYEVTTMQADILWRDDTAIYGGLDQVEKMMRLYFEIFHLVNMMSEIPAKYTKVEGVAEGSDEEQEAPDDSAERYPIVIQNINEAKQEYEKQEENKKRLLKWKKRQLKTQSQQQMGGIIPPEFDPNHPDFNPDAIGGGKYFDEAYNLTANGTLYDPMLLKKDSDVPSTYKEDKKNQLREIDYGWDLPSDWDFK